MSARYPVKWFTQDMQGAPQMSGGRVAADQEPGKLTALLKQVLVTGFGLLPVDSLTYDNVTGEVTATISAGHSYKQDSVLLIDGANEAAYNGEQRLTMCSATQFSYKPTAVPSAGAATGTLSAKVAPVGWEVIAEDTAGEVMIFGSKDPSAGNVKLLVRNTSSQQGWVELGYPQFWAEVFMVESVSNINTYTKLSEGHWPASHFYGLSKWQIVADSKILYLSINYGAAKKESVYSFGDIDSVRSGDKYATVVNYGYMGASTEWMAASYAIYGSLLNHSLENERFLARPYHQLFGVTKWKTLGLFPHMGIGLPLPNPADNGFYVGMDKIPVLESGGTLRGHLPGVINPYNNHPGLTERNHHGMPSFPDKIIRFCKGTYNETAGLTAKATKQSESLIGFDLTGPWR